MRIVQLSDCHLSADPGASYRGQSADNNLEKVWAKAKSWNPDIVMLTGDLSEDASPESYRRLSELLDAGTPLLVLPGNHDDPETMRRYFPSGPWNGPMAFEAGSWLIICLDSKLPGRIEGGFSSGSLHQLRELLSESSQQHVLLALHHQPVPVAARWIDRYPLTSPEPFLNMVDSDPRIRCVVWGHIHHHFASLRDGVYFLGAPSTAANSLPGSVRFELDEAGPACRTLELDESGSVVYGQLYGDQG